VRVIVVGARGVTRELLRRLGERWDATVVDPDPDLLARAGNVRPIESIEGDGSSRVILGKARVAEADAIVAAAGDDEVNLEVCRLGIEAGLVRVLAMAVDPERLNEYRDLGVFAFAPDTLAARRLEIQLEPRRVSSTAFADGRAEALEVRISDDSPVRGMSLRDLHSDSWLVAAVVRGELFIVPHGSTVLQTGDLVTVVGGAADYSRIVRTFTAGEARFPLDYGKAILVAIDSLEDTDGVLAEAIALTRHSAADEIVVAHRSGSEGDDEMEAILERVTTQTEGVDVRFHPVDGDPAKRIAPVVESESIGAVVVPLAPDIGRWRTVRALRRTREWDRPVLFSRGTFPFLQIVAPARETPAGLAAARAAIDIAGSSGGQVTGVAVVPPAFVAGSDSRDAAIRALTVMREEASVLDVPVRRLLRQGNPVRLMESSVGDSGLLVLGRSTRTATILTPGIVGHLLQRVSTSILVVPPKR
jgi:Trk K+ transport system NAD-binding subunit